MPQSPSNKSFLKAGFADLVWIGVIGWSILVPVLFLRGYNDPKNTAPQITADAATACLLLISGFCIAYSIKEFCRD